MQIVGFLTKWLICYSHSVEHGGLVVECEIPYVVSEQDSLNARVFPGA